jgi:hypothetical protein
MSKRVYLSGGMEYAPNEGRDWRRDLQQWFEQELGWKVFNPNDESEHFLARYLPAGSDFRTMKTDDPDGFQRIVRQIVDLDCREIAARSDCVVCYWDQGAMQGAGTKGEITMATYHGKPVYLVTSFPFQEIPGWVLGCTTMIFGSFEQLKDFLARNEKKHPGGRI